MRWRSHRREWRCRDLVREVPARSPVSPLLLVSAASRESLRLSELVTEAAFRAPAARRGLVPEAAFRASSPRALPTDAPQVLQRPRPRDVARDLASIANGDPNERRR